MQLTIYDKSKLLDERFGKWLCRRLLFSVIDEIEKDPAKFELFNSYINQNNIFSSVNNKNTDVDSKSVVLEGARNFICKGTPLVLAIDPNQYVKGLDRVPLQQFCKFINYGNLSIKGFPIFTNVFENAAEHIDELVEEYFTMQDGGSY